MHISQETHTRSWTLPAIGSTMPVVQCGMTMNSFELHRLHLLHLLPTRLLQPARRRLVNVACVYVQLSPFNTCHLY